MFMVTAVRTPNITTPLPAPNSWSIFHCLLHFTHFCGFIIARLPPVFTHSFCTIFPLISASWTHNLHHRPHAAPISQFIPSALFMQIGVRNVLSLSLHSSSLFFVTYPYPHYTVVLYHCWSRSLFILGLIRRHAVKTLYAFLMLTLDQDWMLSLRSS